MRCAYSVPAHITYAPPLVKNVDDVLKFREIKSA